jgi:hypothetical protein
MKKDAKEHHNELMALLDTHPDLSISDHSSVGCNLDHIPVSQLMFFI